MKQRLPKDLKVSDRVQARGHAACGLESCINQDGVCMRCLWTVKEACDLAFRLDHESILSRSGRAMAHDEEQDGHSAVKQKPVDFLKNTHLWILSFEGRVGNVAWC